MSRNKYPVLPPSEAGDAYCRADKAIRDYQREHRGKLTDEERSEFGELLKERARCMSEVLGVHVGSIAD